MDIKTKGGEGMIYPYSATFSLSKKGKGFHIIDDHGNTCNFCGISDGAHKNNCWYSQHINKFGGSK